MAQSEEEKTQANLFAQLEKNDVKVADSDAEEMKENILKDTTGQSWLGLGVHDVLIQSVELNEAKTGTLGIKFTVENSEGKNEVTMWLSEAALPYTIQNISRLVIHNTAEEKKGDARKHLANVTSAKEIFEIAKAKLVDGQCWLSVRESKTQTYTDTKTNQVKRSLDRNLLTYQPKDTAPVTAADLVSGGEPVDKAEIPF